jgi:type II secretory pathway pseudopilin PulG
MFGKNKKYRGFLFTDLVVGLIVLGILLAGLALSLHGFAKFNHYQLLRQNCIAAAQAQLDNIATTGRPIPDEALKRLWPKVSVSIQQSEGTGQWEGMKLVKVTAGGKSFRKEVKVLLSRYILMVAEEEQ